MSVRSCLATLVLFVSALCAQTPCIDAAKAGQIGPCLNVTIPVTAADAQFVTLQKVEQYTVDPKVPYLLSLEFSTKEQALAIVELIKRQYPGSQLTLVDTGESANSFPPFRMLRYFNAGGLYEPRIYSADGTIMIDGQPYGTNFKFGWFLNVSRLIFAPKATGLKAVVELGGAYPHWVN